MAINPTTPIITCPTECLQNLNGVTLIIGIRRMVKPIKKDVKKRDTILKFSKKPLAIKNSPSIPQANVNKSRTLKRFVLLK